MQSEAAAFWVIAPRKGELRFESLANPGPDEVVVRALYSAVSRGTESLVFRGEVPPSEYARMRAPFQAGEFPAPVKYGYASVGEVERGPDSLRGRPVFCLHPHQTRYVVPARAVFPLPSGVPPARAVLAANLETAVNGVWDLSPRVGDRIAVVGGGTVGCLVAWLAGRVPGCQVTLVDINPRRAVIAERLGVGFALPDDADADADCVFHCSASAAGLTTALRIAGFEATVAEMSWYGTCVVNVPLGEAFHARRLCLRSSQVGSVAPARRARWSHRRRLAMVLELLADSTVDCLFTGQSRFEELPGVLARLAENPRDDISHRITYS